MYNSQLWKTFWNFIVNHYDGEKEDLVKINVPKSKSLEAACLALDVGYRHVDTAYAYQVEEEIGQAIQSKIKAGVVKREDLFITTKLWCTCFRPELVKPALEKSLKKLQLDYVDLYIMHYPVPMKSGDNDFPVNEQGKSLLDTVDFCDTWERLEECKDAGLVKSIGVSNFNHRQLERILNKPGLKYKPVCNQVECHLYLNQRKLLDYCESKDIVLVAYGALGTQRYKEWVDQNSPVLLNDPVLCDVAKKNKRSPALIALRYLIQRGIVPLAQSFKENEMRENLQVFGFQLSPEDMKTLDGLNKNFRYLPAEFLVDHPEYPFVEEY
ncbi:aldo-keto reductase family 1 member C13 isoform 2 [Mus musculus]|uniref:aldo-keto reductase family 1 member C13 isoform 2 n=1 Tax=Mus musculus TaxID=10090 RepID=UPI00001E818B|nr:aldo-keto reductase family 1 member C13 isoform 2 [Mus musculus]|eukprot:XP_006516545.1 PREDICTED: aldo-keto reductase family 1 member C13 isoform X1 [Mus musculus]